MDNQYNLSENISLYIQTNCNIKISKIKHKTEQEIFEYEFLKYNFTMEMHGVSNLLGYNFEVLFLQEIRDLSITK